MQLRTQLKCFSFPYTSLKWDSDPNYFHIDGVAHNHQTTKIKGEDPVHSAPTMLSLAPVAKKSAAGSLGRYYIMSPGFLGLWILIFLVDCFVNRMFSTCTNSNCPETPLRLWDWRSSSHQGQSATVSFRISTCLVLALPNWWLVVLSLKQVSSTIITISARSLSRTTLVAVLKFQTFWNYLASIIKY